MEDRARLLRGLAVKERRLEVGGVPHVKRTMRQLVATGTKQVREHIDVPTRMVWGAQDRFVPVDLARAASARLGWTLQVIDDAGHVPHIEQPDAFLEVITRTRS